MLDHHAQLIQNDSTLEPAHAILASQITQASAQSVLPSPSGAQLQTNVSMFAAKMPHTLKLLEPVSVTVDLDFIQDHAKHAPTTTLSQTDIVLLAQLTRTTTPLPRSAIAQLDSLLTNGAFARENAELTKSTQAVLKDAPACKDLQELMESVKFAPQDQLQPQMDQPAQSVASTKS